MKCGVDIGGQSVKIGFIDNKKLMYSYSIKTNNDTLFDDIFKSIKEYINKNNIKIDFIGFGIPGNVKNNYIYKMPNIGIGDIDLNKISKQYFNLPINSSNDANCAALGEALNGKYKSSYFITLGTGVGGGYVYDNKLVEGNTCSAAEIGHLFIDYKHNYQCTCGLKGCLETVASSVGIIRLAKEYKNQYKTNIDFDNISAKSVFDNAKLGDELGLFVLNYVSKSLALAIRNICVTVDPECIYIGGGVSACGNILIDRIKYYMNEVGFYASKDVVIKLAGLGNDAGMIGASLL